MAGNGFFLLAVPISLWMAKVLIWVWGIELIYCVCVIGRAALRNVFKNGREV
jgi:hypothetical protein